MKIYKSKKNGLLYKVGYVMKGYLGRGPLIIEPYNRGYTAADDELIYKKNGKPRKLYLTNFTEVTEE